MKPTQRTLKWFRDKNINVGIVERYIQAGPNRAFGNRSDLFGLFDILAMSPLDDLSLFPGILGIQCFSTAWKEHEDKFRELSPVCRTWIDSGGSIQLWGWRKLKLFRGSKAIRWTPKVKMVYFEDDVLQFVDLELPGKETK